MKFPEFSYLKFKNTRNTIQSYAQILSDIKSTFTPHIKNWEEHSLNIYAKGFTTSPIPIEIGDRTEALDLNINLQEHQLKIFFGRERLSVDLGNQSIARFAKEVESILNKVGIKYNLPENKFRNDDAAEYKSSEATKIWTSVRHIYFVLQKFRGSQLCETSSINFWPHHFDLACILFSGKIIDGKDPEDWDNSREQVNFGFSLGDDGIEEPYLYITAYPFNNQLLNHELPIGAYWQKQGWNGAVLKYSEMLKLENPSEDLLKYFNTIKSFIF